MKNPGREYIGRSGKAQNAVAALHPVVMRSIDGTWDSVENARALFPNEGTVDLRGVLVTQLSAGDFVLFQVVANDKQRAGAKFKATSARKLLRLLDVAQASPEAYRRLLVETGLEAIPSDDVVLRLPDDVVVRLKLSKGADGRWRAFGPTLAALPLRHYETDRLIESPALEGVMLYDLEGCDQLPITLNWSKDLDYVTGAIQAISGGHAHDIAGSLLDALAAHADRISGRLSLAGGGDLGVLAELERAKDLISRLTAEADALARFENALFADTAVQAIISNKANALFAAERPRLAEAVRAEIYLELEGMRAQALDQVKALVAELEAKEMGRLAQRLHDFQAENDAAMATARAKAQAALAAETAAVREGHLARIAELEDLARSKSVKLDALEAREAALVTSVGELAEAESAIVERIEKLSQSASALSSRAAGSTPGHPRFASTCTDTTLPLEKLRETVENLAILTDAGTDILVRLCVFLAAGEVPVVYGPCRADLIEIAGLLMVGGRVAKVTGDPTMVTYEDLWSRAGGNGLTMLGAAAAAASEEAPVLGVVVQADLSGARFWHPSLEDAARRGRLPNGLLVCVTVDDRKSEESEAAFNRSVAVNATDLFANNTASMVPMVLEQLGAEPFRLVLSRPAADPKQSALALKKYGPDLGFVAAGRLARIHAAAVTAFGSPEAEKIVADAAAAFGQLARRQPLMPATIANPLGLPANA